MTNIKSSIKEASGFVEEETGEMLGSADMANKGRQLRNEGRVEQGKAPKLTTPGAAHKEDKK